MKAKIILSIVLAATMAGTLVLGSNMIASYLESSGYIPLAYATDTLIGDSGPGIKAFINEILAVGGGYFASDITPYVSVSFADSESGYYLDPDFTVKGAINATTDLTKTPKKFHVGYPDLGVYYACSDEFENYTKAGKFSWYGNYSEGREIRSILQVNSETIDLGTSSETNVIFNFNLDSDTIVGAGKVTDRSSEFHPVRNFSGQWAGNDWEITFAKMLALTGDSGSASILFEGSVWLAGNYTVTIDGVTKKGTTNLSKNVSFGRIDATFQSGRITMLNFRFDRIDIALCVYPEE